ncbi:hypothetical protein GLYMA_08G300300v4 [Glycine max]|nr:hypothetical protein GLYMA_08G300300v4 [Glycine max]KAH1053830.1 hypothetical protein GYH30_022868 [Glycine max]
MALKSAISVTFLCLVLLALGNGSNAAKLQSTGARMATRHAGRGLCHREL